MYKYCQVLLVCEHSAPLWLPLSICPVLWSIPCSSHGAGVSGSTCGPLHLSSSRSCIWMTKPLGGLSLMIHRPGSAERVQACSSLSHLQPGQLDIQRTAPGRTSELMGQEGSQLDLAVHGGCEARPTVHGGTPVHSDHGGPVATQAQTAL